VEACPIDPRVGVMVLRTFFATIWAMAISGILLASCQVARARARARFESNRTETIMFDRNGVQAAVGRRGGGVTRSAVELKYSKLRWGQQVRREFGLLMFS
jgi:hypothetical protein